MDKYLGNGRAPHRDEVARHLVEGLADVLQGAGSHHPVNQINAVQQGRHHRCELAKVVG